MIERKPHAPAVPAAAPQFTQEFTPASAPDIVPAPRVDGAMSASAPASHLRTAKLNDTSKNDHKNDLPADDLAQPGSTDILRDPRRLAALKETGLLDSAPEEAFDRITRLVAHLLGTPVSLVSLVDADRQFFKSAHGLPAGMRQTPLSHSFCQHVVIAGAPLVVNEATQHAAVRNNPAVREFGIIAYLGVPIRSADGHVLGSLCAVDLKPRQWTKAELGALEDIAEILKSEIDLRREIEERRRAEEQQQLLIRELNHRVRNTLATVQSVVQLSLRAYGDIDEIKTSIGARIGALARAHTMLSERQATTASIADIAAGELSSWLGDRATLDGPPVELPSEHAVAFAMALHEFVTNATKHGALSVPAGRVALTWGIARENDSDIVTLDWTETGGPRAAGPKREGFGINLLKRLIEGPLGGTVTLDYAASGLRARMTVKP